VKLNKKLALAVASAVLSISSSAFAAVDFMNDDAPFKTDLNIAGHNGDLQFYGIIDETWVYQDHGLKFDTALPNPAYPWSSGSPKFSRTSPLVDSQSGWTGQGLQNSRLGVQGGLSLFGDTKFIFNVETGFDPVTGDLTNAAKSLAQQPNSGAGYFAADSSINGGLGNRAAFFGLEDKSFGKLTFGFQNAPLKDILGAADPVKSDSFSPIGESGKIGGGGGVSPDARWTNSFKYSNNYDTGMGVINGTVAYQIGNDTGDMSHGYAWGASFGYHNKNWWDLDAQAGYQYGNDQYKAYSADVASAYGQIDLRMMNIHANAFTLSLKPTEYLKVSGGYNWYMNSTPTDAYYDEGSAWGYQVYSDHTQTHDKNITGDSRYHIAFVGGELDIGKLYAPLQGLTVQAGLYDYTMQAGNIADNNFTKDGDVYSESLVVDYRFNKRFDAYFAATNNKLVQLGSSDATNYTDVKAYGLGVRMKF